MEIDKPTRHSSKTGVDDIRKEYMVYVRSNGFGFSKLIKFNTKDLKKKKEIIKHKSLEKIIYVLEKYKKVCLSGIDANMIKTINTAEKVKRLYKTLHSEKLHQNTEIIEIELSRVNQVKGEEKINTSEIVPSIEIILVVDN
mmetsp:Transcript_17036/g.14980  ORF Transcript_17036/g.14980 Transcript_17036/m.14980 type:complete len:141 (-) Transcript_17036:34-456(-)